MSVESFLWYRKSAEGGGGAIEYYCLGSCYKQGRGTNPDIDKAVTAFQKSAEMGYSPAQVVLGSCYKLGTGVKRNLETAVGWYTRAAEQGDAEGERSLAVCYEHGEGVDQNDELAFKWYRLAAIKEDIAAQYALARSYEFGRGVDKNINEAAYWCLSAARLGHVSAQLRCGEMLKFGLGMKKDLVAAFQWFCKAARQGEAAAERWCAICCEEGAGVSQDLRLAGEWYQKAADHGDGLAQYTLGLRFEDSGDFAHSRPWLMKSVEAGEKRAMYVLGLRCHTGECGIEKDVDRSVRLFEMAAVQGHALAALTLARCFEQGSGVEKNPDIAAEWYKRAANQQAIDKEEGSEWDLDPLHVIGVSCSNPMCDKRDEPAPATPKFKLCSRCKVERYCSVECQRLHWAEHKHQCKENLIDELQEQAKSTIMKVTNALANGNGNTKPLMMNNSDDMLD